MRSTPSSEAAKPAEKPAEKRSEKPSEKPGANPAAGAALPAASKAGKTLPRRGAGRLEHASHRLYGRAMGRPLRGHQAELVTTLLPHIAVAQSDPLAGLGGYKARWLEIGFGGAEHLLCRAAQNPDIAYIGAEPFLNGVAKALGGIEEAGLSNVRLHHGSVLDFCAAIPDGALDGIYVLFPDPWPKPRHFKRRLLSSEFLAQIHRMLTPGGKFCFASDILTYVDWTLTRIDALGDARAKTEGEASTPPFAFSPNEAQDWRAPYAGWPGTRYQAKALREGRIPHYFTFIKNPVPL